MKRAYLDTLPACADPRPSGPTVDGLHRCRCGRAVVLHLWRWVHWPVWLDERQ